MADAEDDYMNIVVPEIEDDPEFIISKQPKRDVKFGIAAIAIAIVAVGSIILARAFNVPPQVWAYFPFLWVLVGALGIWALFSDQRRSLGVFAILGAVVFGVPTIILSIQLLASL